MKIKKLNESFDYNATANLIKNDDTVGLAMKPDYKQATVEGKEIKKTLDDRFKEKDKQMKEFEKLTLDESLFEEVKPLNESAPSIDIIKNIIKELINIKDNADLDEQEVESLEKAVAVLKNKTGLNESFDTETKLYRKAEVLADEIEEFLDITSNIENLSDFMDTEDIQSLTKAHDALYDFAQMYAHVMDDENVFESLKEDTAVLEKPQEVTYYYKNKRDPLSEIIQDELTWGELVYKRSPKTGKLNPTQAPSLNINAEDIGAGEDDKGTYIIGNVQDQAKVKEMENIADKYALEFKSGKHGSWYFTKIYIDEKDFTRPYVDLDALTVKDAKQPA